MPQGHTYSAGEFLYSAKRMVEVQSGGINGRLLNNGYANIFYVVGKGGAVFAVYMRWYGGLRPWFFLCFPLFDGRWLGGRRAFSRN